MIVFEIDNEPILIIDMPIFSGVKFNTLIVLLFKQCTKDWKKKRLLIINFSKKSNAKEAIILADSFKN